MKVTVTSRIDEGMTWTGDVPDELLQGDERYSVNDKLFRLFNRVDEASVQRLAEWGYNLASMAAGDRLEYDGLVWLVESAGFELHSTVKLDELQAKYDRLIAQRNRVLRYHDECPDGDPRKADAERQLRDLGIQVGDVEKELNDQVDYLDRKQQGVQVDRLLYGLPVGFEFKLTGGSSVYLERVSGAFLAGGPIGVSRAYVATYRKNADGLWDQVQGTCESPHVTNMTADHLGFVVGVKAIEAALAAAAPWRYPEVTS